MLRAVAGGGTVLAGVPFCNIVAVGVTVIFIVPAPKCAGRLVTAYPVWVSLIESCGCGVGGYMCGGWHGFLGQGLVTSGSRGTG